MSENKKQKKDEVPLVLPPLEFSSLVLPFFTQGLIILQQIEEEKGEEKNLELVKRMIELLDLLKEKTKGNLKNEEEQFIDSILHQLKVVYMEKAKLIKL